MQLIIVGASDSGKEILSWVNPMLPSLGYHFKGFIDDNHSDAFATIADYQPAVNEVFACSIGNPALRVKLSRLLESKGATFINLIHPTACVYSNVTAKGLIVAPFAYISIGAVLEDYVFLNVGAGVGHHVVIGEGSNICARCDIAGHVIVGKQVLMGIHACIIPSKKIGDGAIIGAGSAVIRDVPAGATVIGVPAKRLI